MAAGSGLVMSGRPGHLGWDRGLWRPCVPHHWSSQSQDRQHGGRQVRSSSSSRATAAGSIPASPLLANPKKHAGNLHASLALLPVDASQAEYLYDRLLNADPIELPVIWKLMRENHQAPVDRLWKVLNDPKADPDQRFRAACALANVEAGRTSSNGMQWLFVTDRLLESVLKNPSHYSPLIETLRPVRDRLLAPLSRTFRDQGKPESERSLATSILSDYAADRPDVLADLLMDAAPPQFATLFPKVQARGLSGSDGPGVRAGQRSRHPRPKEDDKDKLAQRQARAAVALVRLGELRKSGPSCGTVPTPGSAASSSTGSAPWVPTPALLSPNSTAYRRLPNRPLPRVSSSWMLSFSTPKLRCGGR